MKDSLVKKIKNSLGFTLVEIVIVIGIMALLSSIIYTSFDGAKAKSRDQQRVADISTIQLALEIYFNKNRQYPNSLNILEEDGTFNIPTPPTRSNENGYFYFPMERIDGSNRCISYHLWTKLETTSSYLESRKGFDSSSLPTEPGRQLFECGESGLHSAPIDASGDLLIYDVTP
jgi:prepilin-type N-terminal cleavage/methylation domain-containing protein